MQSREPTEARAPGGEAGWLQAGWAPPRRRVVQTSLILAAGGELRRRTPPLPRRTHIPFHPRAPRAGHLALPRGAPHPATPRPLRRVFLAPPHCPAPPRRPTSRTGASTPGAAAWPAPPSLPEWGQSGARGGRAGGAGARDLQTPPRRLLPALLAPAAEKVERGARASLFLRTLRGARVRRGSLSAPRLPGVPTHLCRG